MNSCNRQFLGLQRAVILAPVPVCVQRLCCSNRAVPGVACPAVLIVAGTSTLAANVGIQLPGESFCPKTLTSTLLSACIHILCGGYTLVSGPIVLKWT